MKFGFSCLPQFLAERGELFLFPFGQARHDLPDAGYVRGKYLRDEFAAFGGEIHSKESAIFFALDSLCQAAFFEVIHHHGEVAAGLENLAREGAEAERPKVIERFEHRELAGCKSMLCKRLDRLGVGALTGAKQLDVGREGARASR